MSHSRVILWSGVLVLGATGLAWTGTGAAGARADARRARVELEHAGADAREIVRLRTLLPSAILDASPASELPPRLTAALAACGLPSSALVTFSAEAAHRAGGMPASASLVLAPVTLPQLGRVLDAWRRREPGWVVTGLEITPTTDSAEGGDVPLRVVISLERPGTARGGPR